MLYRPDMSEKQQTLGERIAAARKHAVGGKRFTQAQVALELGVSPQAVSGWERDEAQPELKHITKLADMLGTSINWLMNAEGNPARDYLDKLIAEAPPRPADASVRRAGVMAPRRDEMPQDVPVMGNAAAGNKADFTLSGQIIDYVRRPLGIARQYGVFGLYVVGNSMVPKYEDGNLVFASSARAPVIGDYVVVEMKPAIDGEAHLGFIKRLVKRTGNKIICEQYNPAKQVEFDVRQVVALHRVIPLEELLGV